MSQVAFSKRVAPAKLQPKLSDCQGCHPGEIGFTFHRAGRNKIEVDPHMGVAHMKLNGIIPITLNPEP
jgi:hypothetical protein